MALFLFSVPSFFLTLGLVSGGGGLNWLLGAGTGIGLILPSTSRKVFIFFMIVGYRWSLMLQGVYLIRWVILSLLKMCVPCMDVIFTSTSTTSTRSLHLKKPCRKLHSGWSKHVMSCLKWSIYKFILFLFLFPSCTMLFLVLSLCENFVFPYLSFFKFLFYLAF